MSDMRVMTSKVVDGKIEFETDLKEGTSVAILAPDDSGFYLTADEEDELFRSLSDIRTGNYEDGTKLLAQIKEMAGR